MNQKSDKRNHLLAPRAIFNTTQIYRLYILKELTKGHSLYGKQIYDTFNEHFKGLPVPVSYSTIYNTLHDLEEQNYVDSKWETGTLVKNRTKRYYRITDEGLQYYRRMAPIFIDNLKKHKSIVDKFIEIVSK